MPAWLLPIILEFVLKFGIPALITWLAKIFRIGVSSETVSILEDFQKEAKINKTAARERAKERLKACHSKGA